MMNRLIILDGLSGTGKTTIARELARRIGAVHLRIDSIEQAIRECVEVRPPLDEAGYRIAYGPTTETSGMPFSAVLADGRFKLETRDQIQNL
jgi:2-phosphoglycerate kinase